MFLNPDLEWDQRLFLLIYKIVAFQKIIRLRLYPYQLHTAS